jgi:type I restriction enzyme, S subunit
VKHTLMVPLGELMARRLGTLEPSKFPEEHFDLYSIPAFDSRTPEIRLGAEIGSAKQMVAPDDILLSKIVPHIRRSWVVGQQRGRRIIASGEWIVFRSERVHPDYLRHLLLADVFHSQFMRTVSGVGGSLLRAKPAQVAQIEIPLPPIDEQRRIAAILDKADELRAKRKEALALLDGMAQSVFVSMFGDPVQNPKGWSRVRFSHILDNIESGWSPVCLDRPADGEEWGVLKLGAVTRCEYDWKENKALPSDIAPDKRLEVNFGDLLFSRKNTYELVAACALVYETQPRLMMSDLIFRFRVKPDAGLDANYLHQLLINNSKRREIRKLASGSAGSMPNISKAKLFEAEIEVPPEALQLQFSRRVTKLREQMRVQKNALKESDALFDVLQHRAFRGEL